MHHTFTLIVTFLLLLLASSEEPHNPKRAQPPAGTPDEHPRRVLHDDPPPPLRLNTSAGGPPDVYLRVPDLGVWHIGLEVDNLQANISLAASIANMVQVHAGVAVGVDKVNISLDNVAARLDLVIRLDSLVDMVNRTMRSLDLNPALVNVINSVGDVGSSAVQGLGSVVGGALGKTKAGGNLSINSQGIIMEEVVGQDGKVEKRITGNYKENMVPTGEVKALPKEEVAKTYRYDDMDALVDVVFDKEGEVVRTEVLKTAVLRQMR